MTYSPGIWSSCLRSLGPSTFSNSLLRGMSLNWCFACRLTYHTINYLRSLSDTGSLKAHLRHPLNQLRHRHIAVFEIVKFDPFDRHCAIWHRIRWLEDSIGRARRRIQAVRRHDCEGQNAHVCRRRGNTFTCREEWKKVLAYDFEIFRVSQWSRGVWLWRRLSTERHPWESDPRVLHCNHFTLAMGNSRKGIARHTNFCSLYRTRVLSWAAAVAPHH